VTYFVTKPYALLFTRFREVLLLDSDNLPLRDPTYLFDDEAYRKAGVLCWPDMHWKDLFVDPKLWPEIGLNESVVKVRGQHARIATPNESLSFL